MSETERRLKELDLKIKQSEVIIKGYVDQGITPRVAANTAAKMHLRAEITGNPDILPGERLKRVLLQRDREEFVNFS